MSSSEGAILVDSEGENEKENTNCLKTESKKVREIKSRSRATSSRRSLNSRSSTLQKKKIKESVKVSKDVSDSPVEETVSGSGDDFAPDAISKRKSKGVTISQRRELKLLEHHPEIKTEFEGVNLDEFAGKKHDKNISVCSTPPQLRLKLLPFQAEALQWFKSQEDGRFKGGILADEMGMGKTIQMISLLLTDLPAKMHTLVITPTVALLQWKSELFLHTEKNSLSVFIYYGSACSDLTIEDLKKYNVVLTTYSSIESAYRRQHLGFRRNGKYVKKSSLLHSFHWDRIILDEAHHIKEKNTSTAQSAYKLEATFRWGLSGTPLQNRLGELYSLIKFLRIDPYAYYYCYTCSCKSLTWNFSDHSYCDLCGHYRMQHFCFWNKEIMRPIQKFGNFSSGLTAFGKLGWLLHNIMIRRTKIEKAADLGLPPRLIYRRSCYFNDEELDFYESLYSESRTTMQAYVEAGTLLNNYAHIFDLLTKMRQAADHPFLVVFGNRLSNSLSCSDVCGICQGEAEDPIISKCHHVFCREDVKEFIDTCPEPSPVCPKCYIPLTIDLEQPTLAPSEKVTSKAALRNRTSILNRMDIGGWKSSTKIEALLEELSNLRNRNCTIKSIVFSQYCSFLDLIEWRLLRCGFNAVKLDGRMTPEQRASVIDRFSKDPNIAVFLISLKAGGVALNLTEASRVFLMDCWWNPAVEYQAMDRIHRLGQLRPIEVIRIIVENSIESRILQLQEKKLLLFESTIGLDANSMNRLVPEDLAFLFST